MGPLRHNWRCVTGLWDMLLMHMHQMLLLLPQGGLLLQLYQPILLPPKLLIIVSSACKWMLVMLR